MNVVRSRSCAAAGGLALALVLATPLAALAAAPEPAGSERGQSDERRPTSPAASPSAAPAASPAPAASRAPSPAPSSSRAAARPASPAASRPASTTTQDPRGNNGTIKVDGVPFESSRGHEPHVGCEMRLVFWGFDADDTASITVTGIAPTGGGLLHSTTGTLISDDAAGGGQDLDESVVLSVADELSELQAVAPHPQQGWHVKVEVDVDDAPGGAKQKTVWLECPALVADGGTGGGGTVGGGTDGSGGTGGGSTDGTGGGSGTGDTDDELTLGGGGVELTDTGVLSSGATAGAGAGTFGGGAVRAQGATAPQALPFTGATAVGALTALGVGSVLAGGLAHRLGRRRSALA